MKKQIDLSLLIIGILAIFIVGLGSGFLYAQQASLWPQQNSSQIASAQAMATAIKSLSSKLISGIHAYGRITQINPQNIVLSDNGNNLAIKIGSATQVSTFASSVEKKIDISALKLADNLNVTLNLLPDGTLTASSIVIQPEPIIKKK